MTPKKTKQIHKNQAVNYVCVNARFMDDAPTTPYFVRFPTFYGGKIFFSDDTNNLVDQLFAFGRTKEGKELWKLVPAGKYDKSPEFEDEEIDYEE